MIVKIILLLMYYDKKTFTWQIRYFKKYRWNEPIQYISHNLRVVTIIPVVIIFF